MVGGGGGGGGSGDNGNKELENQMIRTELEYENCLTLLISKWYLPCF